MAKKNLIRLSKIADLLDKSDMQEDADLIDLIMNQLGGQIVAIQSDEGDEPDDESAPDDGDSTDCQESDGIATGLVDAVIMSLRVLHKHYKDSDFKAALLDIADDKDYKWFAEQVAKAK